MATSDLDEVRRFEWHVDFTVPFAGMYINAHGLSRVTGIDRSFISRVLRGHRGVTLRNARRISAALGMTLEEFASALDGRAKQVT